MDKNIQQSLREVLPELKEKYGVAKIAVFGSSSRAEMKPDSDVDLVIEFERPLGLEFIELNEYLREYLHRKVDILTPDGLKSIRSERIKKSIRESLTYV
ncbi:MAG: nucleotidyltransferase [Spirochaetes bacterium GWF1_49_6]|jgi:hypothetical protein|nr:MAG: nucleotidyltransferase [Spirochaetes bacterium GWF1_49_6]